MSIYVWPADCTHPSIKVSESHCDQADRMVRNAILAKAINAAELDAIELPNPALTTLGRMYALSIAALEASRAPDDGPMAQHKAWAQQAKDFAANITRASLEIPDAVDDSTISGGYGSFEMMRAG